MSFLRSKLWLLLLLPLFAGAFALGINFVYYRGNYEPPPRRLPAYSQIDVVPAPVQGFEEVLSRREGLLLVDEAHSNDFTDDEINALLVRVAERGYSIDFLKNSDNLSEKLDKADSFLAILPEDSYSSEETVLVRSFVDGGGKLLLVGDPARTSAINSLSRDLGIVFQPGYLYNIVEHDANFRNIFLRDFRPDDITQGLSDVVLYLAGALKGSGLDLALTDSNTHSSMIESTEPFSPLVKSQDGRVVAIYDLTFMTPAYSSVLDNERLIANLANYLTKSKRILFD